MPRDEHVDGQNEPNDASARNPPNDDLTRLQGFLSEGGLPEAGRERFPDWSAEPPPQLSPQNLSGDRYDARLFGELVEASSELRELLDVESRDTTPTFRPLMEDFFRAFYKVSPTFAEEEAVQEQERTVNRPFVERLLEDEQTSIARISTCLDELSSGLATLETGKKALQELKDRPDLREWMEQAVSQPTPDDPSGGESPRDEQEDEDREESPSTQPQAPPASPPARAMRRLVREAISAARNEAEDVRSALSGWGLEPGDLKTVPLSERLELARELRTPRMRSLAELVGRMKQLAGAVEREKVRSRQDEIHSVTLGGEIEWVLPAELASGLASSHPLRRLDFTRRLLEGSLLSYELAGTDHLGRGPVIAAIDISLSMEGEPLEWASAVALTLASVAASEGRFAHLIYFNTRIVHEVRLDGSSLSRRTALDPRTILAAATVGASGGTAYETPVLRAIEVMDEPGAPAAGKADVLMVTDGICELSEEVLFELDSARERRGFKLVSVLIGDYAISGGAGSLDAFSDAVIPLSRIAGGPAGAAQAGDIFENL
jgi:uncharacterized protein with von Willebrand factor type A (vWA) domain